jgi:thiol-disulfide isomerase/thioredoxin
MKCILVTLCVFLAASGAKAQPENDLINHPAPPIIFQQCLNKQVAPDFYKGKILVIDFWATWCAPCIAGFPHFNKLAETFQNKDVVFATLTDEPAQTAQRFFKRTKKQLYGLKLIDTTKANSKAFKAFYIPYCVVIDQDNIIKWAGDGGELTDSIILRVIKKEVPVVPQREIVKVSLPSKRPVKPLFSFNIKLSDTTKKGAAIASSANYKGDVLDFTRTNTKLGDFLEQLTGYGKRTRIITSDTTKLNQLIDVDFESKFDTTVFRKYTNTVLLNKPRINLLMSLVGDALNFDTKLTKAVKKHYELIVTDSVKLHTFVSMQTHHSSFSDDYFPKFEIVGYTLKNMVTNLEQSAKIIITTDINDKTPYDLSLDISNVKTLEESLRFHGLGLKEVNSEVELLTVTFY